MKKEGSNIVEIMETAVKENKKEEKVETTFNLENTKNLKVKYLFSWKSLENNERKTFFTIRLKTQLILTHQWFC